jgi:hypothetical protein
VQAGPVGKAGVNVRRRVVQATPAQGREPLGQPAHTLRIGKAGAGPDHPRAAVDPYLLGSVHHDVGHQRVREQARQRSRPGDLVENAVAQPEQRGAAQGCVGRFGPDGLQDGQWGRYGNAVGQTASYASHEIAIEPADR